MVGEAREGFREQLLVREAFDYFDVQALDEVEDLLLGRVAHLDVELGVLGLAVAALVLVPERPRDLEVPLEAGDHEELLELLRRLRQGVELAREEAARDEVVSGALGRGGG